MILSSITTSYEMKSIRRRKFRGQSSGQYQYHCKMYPAAVRVNAGEPWDRRSNDLPQIPPGRDVDLTVAGAHTRRLHHARNTDVAGSGPPLAAEP
jgi:hypothetical protein